MYDVHVTETQIAEHRITWFVWAGNEKIRRTATMRGSWGYDVECSCGQKSRTGGATLGYMKGQVYDHKNFGFDL